MGLTDSLTNLDAKRDALAANLVAKGVTAASSETLGTLVAKVLDIEGSTAPPTIGFLPTAWNESGYITEAILLGMTTIPIRYFSNTSATVGHFINLAEIILPNEITLIDDYAFAYCDDLANTALVDSITTIDTYAFSYCKSLALTTLPASLATLGTYAFLSCSNLAITEIPIGVTTIPTAVFNGCTGIVTLSMPRITQLGTNTFAGCAGLQTVTIGSPGHPVTTIGTTSFVNCTQAGLTINVYTAGGAALANAPWGATNATINYIAA